MTTSKRISFQGDYGAYSDMACRIVYPDYTTVPCVDFESTLNAVHEGKSDLAMVPIDNSTAGRVADIHRLLPASDLHIIGEFFLPINHCLLGVKGATIKGMSTVHSHIHALPQCRSIIKKYKLTPAVHDDTAGAARTIAEKGDKRHGAIASKLAAEIYNLEILEENIEDFEHNTTRFLIMSPKPIIPDKSELHLMTTFVFSVRNIPAALYKALGGFATNGINMTKLESYMVDGHFSSAQFYCDVDGHPDDASLKLAFEELYFFAKEVKILGTYAIHPFRQARKTS